MSVDALTLHRSTATSSDGHRPATADPLSQLHHQSLKGSNRLATGNHLSQTIDNER